MPSQNTSGTLQALRECAGRSLSMCLLTRTHFATPFAFGLAHPPKSAQHKLVNRPEQQMLSPKHNTRAKIFPAPVALNPPVALGHPKNCHCSSHIHPLRAWSKDSKYLKQNFPHGFLQKELMCTKSL